MFTHQVSLDSLQSADGSQSGGKKLGQCGGKRYFLTGRTDDILKLSISQF